MMRRFAAVMAALSLVCLSSCARKPEESGRRVVPQYTIEQFYKNKEMTGGRFSPDESRLLVSSNESGIYNLYEIGVGDGGERQVTASTDDSFFAIDYVPGTNQMLYAADRGGNENDHIYLLSADGASRDLTAGAKEKATFLSWSLDKKALYYLSNKRDARYFDLYKMRVGTWDARMLYRNDAGYDIEDVSWNERVIALRQNISTSENKLLLGDLASGQVREISDPVMPGTYSSSGFSKDGASLFYIADAGKEFRYLMRFDLASGERTPVFDTTWDVMYSYMSEHDKYRVIAVNVDGKNKLKITDTHTGAEVIVPEIPDGDVNAVAISPSEKLMRLTVGTSKAPGNMYVYSFDTKNLRRLTNTLNSEINPDDLVAAEIVRFPSFDGLQIPAIYYRPEAASAAHPVPALVWVHGGPGGQSRVGYFGLIQYLVNHGYAILAVNNRGSSGYGKTFFKMDDRDHGDRDLKDCVYGKKYLQTLDYVAKDKIGIIGGSYGGFMTMAAMTLYPDEFMVGVDMFGVTNWLRTLRSIPPYWESFRKALYAEMGDPFTADSVRLYGISPLFHAQQITHPVMVLQGANDVRVLKVESDEIVAAVRKNNVPVEYTVFPDEGHGFVKRQNEINGYGAVLVFLDRYLK